MTETANTIPSGETLTAKTICLSIDKGKFGNSKKASLAPVEVNADKSLLRMSMTLVDSPEIAAIDRHDSQTTKYLASIGHNSMFKGGIWIVSVAIVKQVDDYLHVRLAERETLIEIAASMFDQRVAETKARLGDCVNDKYYPTSAEFRACYEFKWKWFSFDTPARLKQISAELFEQERQKAASELASVAQECRDAMRAQLLKLVGHLHERLTPSEDGKTKRFTKSTVAQLNDFLSMFELKDVTADSDLGDVVKQARAAMEGIDAKDLQTDELIRTKMQQVFGDLEGTLQTMVVGNGERAIDFDDEGPLPTATVASDDEALSEPEDLVVVH